MKYASKQPSKESNQTQATLNTKTYLVALLAAPGCSWLLLAALLAAPGYSWLFLAAPGCFWLLLAAICTRFFLEPVWLDPALSPYFSGTRIFS